MIDFGTQKILGTGGVPNLELIVDYAVPADRRDPSPVSPAFTFQLHTQVELPDAVAADAVRKLLAKGRDPEELWALVRQSKAILDAKHLYSLVKAALMKNADGRAHLDGTGGVPNIEVMEDYAEVTTDASDPKPKRWLVIHTQVLVTRNPALKLAQLHMILREHSRGKSRGREVRNILDDDGNVTDPEHLLALLEAALGRQDELPPAP